MNKLKIKTPAKINLTLEILGKRPDGFHEIQSVMQTVSLYDYLTIEIQTGNENSIILTGNNPLIPYDKTNLVHIAAEKFLKKANISNRLINIYLEKNIPVAAGLAGGSSNAAGILFGLNQLLSYPLNNSELSELASEIGADVNFCLWGGTKLATSKGEKLEKVKTPDLNIAIVKPKNLFISAKEAYTKYAALENKPKQKTTQVLVEEIEKENVENISILLNNGLEEAILPDYPEILEIKHMLINRGCLNAVMSGSGPSVFGIYKDNIDLSYLNSEKFDFFKVKTIGNGVIPE